MCERWSGDRCSTGAKVVTPALLTRMDGVSVGLEVRNAVMGEVRAVGFGVERSRGMWWRWLVVVLVVVSVPVLGTDVLYDFASSISDLSGSGCRDIEIRLWPF